jgi:hypothetical protein
MLGDIVGAQIARGAHGLSDAHFDYTAAVERVLAVHFGSGLELTHSLLANTLTETLHLLRYEAHGVAGAGGATVTVTFGGQTLLTLVVAAGQRWDVEGDLLRTGVGQVAAMSCGLAVPGTVEMPSVTAAVDMTVDQPLVVAIDDGAVEVLRLKLSGAP